MISPLIPAEVLALEGPGVALFDADGVLWEGDIAEEFTMWMIGEGHFDGLLWPVYEHVLDRDPEAACVQLLSFFAGMPTTELRTHVEHFWQSTPERPWIPETKATIQWARQHGWTIYVVSASAAPLLAPLWRHLPVDEIFGMEPEVDDEGRYTGEATGIRTVGTGKAEKVRSVTKAPIRLAAGDTALDIPMLQLSEDVAWVINPDADLRDFAENANWLMTWV